MVGGEVRVFLGHADLRVAGDLRQGEQVDLVAGLDDK